MTALTVIADADARNAGDIDAVIASMPVSLARAERSADIAAIAGSSGWPSRVEEALSSGVRGVLVVEPDPADVTGLLTAQVPVVIDRAFAGNPGLSATRTEIASIDEHALFEARAMVPVGADLDAVLLGQLALVRATGSPVVTARLLHRDHHGYTVRGLLEVGRAVLLTATTSDAEASRATIRLLGTAGAIELDIPTPVAARPMRATITSAAGALLLPTQYETAHRANWRRLHQLVSEGALASDITEFAADMNLAVTL